MGHDNDRAALVTQSTQNCEELILLVRGEDGSGFVENQQPGVAIEQLENLNPLLHSDGQVLHLSIRVDGQMMLVAQTAQPPRSCTQVQHRTGILLQAEHGVLDHGKAPHQHEFLVHHADAECDGVFGAGDRDRLAVDQDRSGIHGMESVEDLHQGAFAGAVFSQQSVDLAASMVRSTSLLATTPGNRLTIFLIANVGKYLSLSNSRHFSEGYGLFSPYVSCCNPVQL